MSTAPASPSDRAAALATFDAARDAFLAAFAQAPDEALAYVPEGDEYAVGTLVPHLADVIDRYLGQFERMRQSSFAPLDLAADADSATRQSRRHAELAAFRPTAADRPRMLAELTDAHQRVHRTVHALDEATFTRQAPVIYSAGTDLYPTSCRDIMGWLSGHYDEHTTQVGQLLSRWRGHGL